MLFRSGSRGSEPMSEPDSMVEMSGTERELKRACMPVWWRENEKARSCLTSPSMYALVGLLTINGLPSEYWAYIVKRDFAQDCTMRRLWDKLNDEGVFESEDIEFPTLRRVASSFLEPSSPLFPLEIDDDNDNLELKMIPIRVMLGRQGGCFGVLEKSVKRMCTTDEEKEIYMLLYSEARFRDTPISLALELLPTIFGFVLKA